MDLKEQRYVCTLALSGSLLEASRQLDITSSALSLYISNLEKRLMAPLFDRVGKHFVLTYAGEAYVEAARKMLDIKEGFDATLNGITNNTSGRLRVAVQRYRSPYISPQLLVKFSELYPNFKIELLEPAYSSMEDMLRENRADIFFGNIPVRLDEFEYTTILQDAFALFTSDDHPVIKRAHPMAGSQYPWVELSLIRDERILIHRFGYSSRILANQLFEENNFKPTNLVEIEKTDTIMQMASCGYGVSLLPAGFAEYPRFKRPLRLFSVGSPQKTLEFAAVYRKGRPLPQYLQDVIEIMKEIVQATHVEKNQLFSEKI